MMRLFGRLAFGCVVAVAAATVVHAQWLNYKAPGVPRTADGKPNLTAPTPRSLDGHPDLSGVWMHEMTSLAELRSLLGSARIDEARKADVPGMEIGTQHKYVFNILADVPSADSLLKPAALERMRQTRAAPVGSCGAGVAIAGFPVAGLLSEPIKIVQAPRLTVLMYEVGGTHRQIYTDGRALPADINLPAYFGYSVGRWDRDTFVIETVGFNDKTRLDIMGHPHSEQLRVTERLRRRDFGHLDYEMTFDDPVMYARPFTIRISHDLLADADIFEMFSENEKDCAHIKP
jgi:hypothetical protein